MSVAIDFSKNLAIGSYRSVFYPGETGLKFDKTKPLKKARGFTTDFTLQIDSAQISKNRLIVVWTVTQLRTDVFFIANIEEGVLLIREHFLSLNPGKSFSIESTEILTAGVTPSKDLLEKFKNPIDKLIPNLSDLSSKIGIALIVLAVGIAFFAGYKAFGKSA